MGLASAPVTLLCGQDPGAGGKPHPVALHASTIQCATTRNAISFTTRRIENRTEVLKPPVAESQDPDLSVINTSVISGTNQTVGIQKDQDLSEVGLC